MMNNKRKKETIKADPQMIRILKQLRTKCLRKQMKNSNEKKVNKRMKNFNRLDVTKTIKLNL